MNWQQSQNGNLNAANASTAEEALRARIAASRNSLGQQHLTINEQLALQNLGLTGGGAVGTPGFQNYPTQGVTQGLLQNQGFHGAQGLLGGNTLGGHQQGLLFGNGTTAGSFGKANPLQNQAALNNLNANQQNTALMALIQQQMLHMQHNGGLQNAGQASHINSNLAQALVLAQQQATATGMRQAAALASNPSALQSYLYRVNQQQALAQNMRQMQQMGQMSQAQLLQQQALHQATQLQAAAAHQQQQHQMSANMAALLRGNTSAGFGETQMMGGGAAQGTQNMNLAGFNSTGLANSPLASAPLLPINGSDLAKPSQKTSAHDSMASQLAISGVSSDVVKQMEALSFGNSVTRPGSAVSVNADSVRSQTMSPTGAAQKDTSKGGHASPTSATQLNLGQGTVPASSPFTSTSRDRDLTTLKTLGQMLAKTGNTVESAVQNGLLGGCNAEDVKIVWEAYVMEMATLKQYDSANRAFQQQGAELVAKRAKSDDPEATKLLLEAANAPTATVPTNMSQALQYLGWDAGSSPPNPSGQQSQRQSPPHPQQPTPVENSKATVDKKDEVITDGARGWDGVIENEHDYVPHHLIDEVNTPLDQATDMEALKEEEFNATNYGFFSMAGGDTELTDCPLEEEIEADDDAPLQESADKEYNRERTKSEDNNNHAEDDLVDVDTTAVAVNAQILGDSEKTDSRHCELKTTNEDPASTDVAPSSTEPAATVLA